MIANKSNDKQNEKLRLRAEDRNRDSSNQISKEISELGHRELIQQLQSHQIELEMQNEELRQAQIQIEKSAEKYFDLYDIAPIGYVSLNQEGRIIETNLTFSGLLCIERARLINSLFMVHLPPQERDKFQHHLHHVFMTKERQCCELRMKNDRYVQVDSIFALKTGDSDLCRMTVTDITERKKIEDELIKVQDELEKRVEERTSDLSESERKYRKLSQEFQTLLNTISDTLILLSPDMDIAWTNNNKILQPNESTTDEVEKYCNTLIHHHSTPYPDCPVTRCFVSGKNEMSVLTHNGAFLDLRAFPIKEAEQVTRVLLLVSDITEKMVQQSEAIQAAHMASLGELAAGVAHEINNPITGIINYGQILINECGSGSMEKDIGERIVKEGERVGRIVKTLLAYSHDRREAKKVTRIPTIIEESMILIQAQIRKEGINLKINIPDNLHEINADFQQIQQCIINIVNNARYALNDKYQGRHEDKRLEITGENVTISDHPYVRIIFTDTGVGIPTQDIPMLTKPFFSTKPFGKGTGLGLDITRKIIIDHGGQIHFESTLGEFTKVFIDLPAHQTIKEVEHECENSCH